MHAPRRQVSLIPSPCGAHLGDCAPSMDGIHSAPSLTRVSVGGPAPRKEHPMILDPRIWFPGLIG